MKHTTYKNIILALLFILIIRVCLFNNPFIWKFYNNFLSSDDVGMLQKSIIKFKLKHYKNKSSQPKYLAVGSSQTFALFSPFANANDSLEIFTLAGMGPLDMVLYRKYIQSFRPQNIILWLSEFDISRPPEINAAKLAPPQNFYLLRLIPKLTVQSDKREWNLAIKEMIVGELFPEYKYSFIFKGILDKLTYKIDALNTKRLSSIPMSSWIEQSLKNIKKHFDENNIDFNISMLNEFLNYCQENDIKVFIVEGQYNPVAYTKNNLDLNQKVKARLVKVADQFANITFLDRSTIYELGPNDYSDIYHTKPKSGLRYVQSLITYLESNN